jgi:NADP-dependent 3-hydroxy acid dehydrogenase YdfG
VTSYFLGKCILITGASSGIGRTLAFWYLNNGARVALVGRDVAEMDKIAKQFPS